MITTTARFNPLAQPNVDNPVAPTAPAPAAAPVKRVSLGGMNKKKDAASSSNYPVFPDPNGKAAEAAAQIIRDTEQFEALKGSLEANKKFIIDLAAPFHFQFAAGKLLEKGLGILVHAQPTPEELEAHIQPKVRIDYKNSYPTLEDVSSLQAILGGRVDSLFSQTFKVEIDGDKLPIAQAQDIINELQLVFAKYNATDALSYKEGMKPVADFHLKRHTLLTVEENLRVHNVCPIRAAVATKNVK